MSTVYLASRSRTSPGTALPRAVLTSAAPPALRTEPGTAKMAGMPIEHISDTARWVAVYRAMETERPDAIFSDPFARRLAGARGDALVQGMPKGRQMSWPMVVRTAVMDEIIMRCITKQGVDCVLNLAAGLDARPWRLPLAPTLRWIDVDHPFMIDLKLGEMAKETPKCQYEGVRLDLADGPARKALFDR